MCNALKVTRYRIVSRFVSARVKASFYALPLLLIPALQVTKWDGCAISLSEEVNTDTARY